MKYKGKHFKNSGNFVGGIYCFDYNFIEEIIHFGSPPCFHLLLEIVQVYKCVMPPYCNGVNFPTSSRESQM